MEASVLGLNFWDTCNFDQILITLGSGVTSWSGAANFIVTIIFRFIDELGNPAWQNAIVNAIDTANMTGTD